MKSWTLVCVVALGAVLVIGLLAPGCGGAPAAPAATSAPAAAAPAAPAAQGPAAAAPAAPAAAAKVYEWRMHTPWSDTRPEFGEMQRWTKAMGEASGGRLKITAYPVGALGFKDADMLRLVGQQNAIEMFVGSTPYVMQDDPALGQLLPVMAFQNFQQEVVKVIPKIRPMSEALYGTHNIRILSEMLWNFNDVYIITKGPWNTLEQIKGKKIRAWGAPQADTLNRLGVSGSVMAQAELYLAMKTGVFDGALHTSNGAVVLSLNEVATHMTPIYAPIDDLHIGINENVFKGLPTDLQDILTTKGKEWTAQWMDMTKQPIDIAEFNQTCKDRGLTILPPFPAADKAAMRKAALEVWRAEGTRYGGAVVDVQNKVAAELKQVGIE